MPIKILMLHDDLNYACGISSQLYHLLEGLTLHKYISVTLAVSGGDALSKFDIPGVEVIIDSNLNWENRTYLRFAQAVIATASLVKNNKFDIVHSQNFYTANIAAQAKRLVDFISIQSHHNFFRNEGKLRLATADYHITVNPAIREFLLRHRYCTQNNITVIPYSADLNYGNKKNESPPYKIIAASRMIPEKGLDCYIKACALLPGEIREKVICFIAGTGRQESYLRQINERLSAGVIFIGLVKNLPEVLSHTHIFVMPTKWNCEGYPMTMIEAAMTGNIIISSDFEGRDSYFYTSADRLSFAKNNHYELAQRICEAVDNYTYWMENAMKYKKEAEPYFDRGLITESYARIYRKLYGKSSADRTDAII